MYVFRIFFFFDDKNVIVKILILDAWHFKIVYTKLNEKSVQFPYFQKYM